MKLGWFKYSSAPAAPFPPKSRAPALPLQQFPQQLMQTQAENEPPGERPASATDHCSKCHFHANKEQKKIKHKKTNIRICLMKCFCQFCRRYQGPQSFEHKNQILAQILGDLGGSHCHFWSFCSLSLSENRTCLLGVR